MDTAARPHRFSSHSERLEAFRQAMAYPVVTADFCGGRDPLWVTEAVLRGGARVVQIREKTMYDGPFLALLKQARELTWRYGALLIVDDRVDAALAVQADGVHLGQEDFPIAEARRLAPELLLGASTHNAEEVRQAQADGCSYLNVGPIYPTQTKQLACRFLGVETLKTLIPLVKCPFSVMGGIKFAHLAELSRLGAHHIAAVTAFSLAEDPAREIRAWQEEIARFSVSCLPTGTAKRHSPLTE